jgi:hypothetical protein
MDVVVSSGWSTIPSKLEEKFHNHNLTSGAGWQKIKMMPSAVVQSAMIEFDHYGLNGFAGRIRAVVSPASAAPDKVDGVAATREHKFVDLKSLPKGMWLITTLKPSDFPRCWDDEDTSNYPQISASVLVAGRPQGYTDASLCCKMRMHFLCSVVKGEA